MSKWNCPAEWLIEKIRDWDEEELRKAFRVLVLDSEQETIQDIFQQEMEEDGFFEEEG